MAKRQGWWVPKDELTAPTSLTVAFEAKGSLAERIMLACVRDKISARKLAEAAMDAALKEYIIGGEEGQLLDEVYRDLSKDDIESLKKEFEEFKKGLMDRFAKRGKKSGVPGQADQEKQS